jgi:dienelactone hydrolase
MPNTAPYGSWSSPITSDLIVAQITMLSDVRIDGDDVYWLEGRPQEQGRNAIVRAGADGTAVDITPPGFNVRTRVHEYGGGSWSLAGGTCIFSNFEDQRLYIQRIDQSDPQPLTPEPISPKQQLRYSDGMFDRARRRWIGVREDHTGEGEPVNTIVAIDIDQIGTSPGRVLVRGHDFFSSARLSPNAGHMLWLAWDHPNMPWNGTTLYLADIGADGAPVGTQVIAGGQAESIFQPEWSPDGDQIVFVSDRTGWWNVYAYELATGTTRSLCPMQAEFGVPQWNFGMSMFAFAFGLFYPPRNPDYVGTADERPPLLVKCHGGPTSSASSALNLGTQFWISRGIAVLDVNYGGSAGFGREYRERLWLNWGVVDVDDCVNGAKYLAQRGLVDLGRVVISGGSAGGYTTLAALTFRDFFQGGASYYGVSDAAALARDTHKFESRYLDWLIGPYPEEEARYRERSPVFHADRLSKPVIFFQGSEDAVVPPNQTEVMVEALRRNGNAVGYFLFAGEQHGFRRAANIKRCLDAELTFYAVEVFRIGLTF